MFKVNIEQLVPRFIMQDKNGYAVAKAIQAGLQIMNDTIDAGVKCITDVERMPEWRLDELAWEYNLLYDYGRDVEIKRNWIRNAVQTYSTYGTPGGLLMYLQSVYDVVTVEEWWQYAGAPYHFRVNVSGLVSDEENEWAIRAINGMKNLRSVLDGIIFNSGESNEELWYSGIAISGEELNVESIDLQGDLTGILTSDGDVLVTSDGDRIVVI